MNIVVIANPVAGMGRAADRMSVFASALRGRGHGVEVYFTEGPGQAAVQARSLGFGIDRLVIAGGDGTLNEVLNGLTDPARIPLLHFPTGTANMLAWDLGISGRPPRLVEVLESGAVRRIDMGLAGSRRFLMLASAGFDAAVTAELAGCRTGPLGYRGYVSPIYRALRNYRSANLEIDVDGKERMTGSTVMALKVRHYGGIMVFSEAACPDSGCFEVCIFRHGSVPALARYGLAALIRRAANLRGITRVSGSRIRITSREPAPVQVDGDYLGTTPVEITLVPGIVPVMVPKAKTKSSRTRGTCW
jgi:diacylglycerol kinase (ATP)